ncbi:MAG: glycoside hydrolase family 3 C-terminal domain-containing protein [Phycisphaerae bacterium]
MPKPRIKKTQVNRREFMATAAAFGAIATLTGCSFESKTLSPMAVGGIKTSATGLSDAAYQKAWHRAAAMVQKMTLAEKISQTCNTAPAIKRLGISRYQYWSEALHGYGLGPGPKRRVIGTGFPEPLALAGAWHPQLNRRVYDAISDEARAYHNRYGYPLTFYSPQTLNLHRDPRWGRCQEAPGEDPCLASTLAVEVIRGMQGDSPNYLKTVACAKHFICNNTENDRASVSAAVNPRNFWEYYTRAYRAAVVEGGVFSVMVSYNAINGIPCAADRFLLTDLLRQRWGFNGYVTSDCDAVATILIGHHYVPTLPQAAALAMEAGCDLNCGTTMPTHLAEALADELVSEQDISRAVTRILTARVLLGEFDAPQTLPYNKISFNVVNSSAHQKLARQAARESIILLKNDNGFLPLQKSNLKTIAVIGPQAGFHIGGYSNIASDPVSPLDGIAAAIGVKAQYPWVRAQDAVQLSQGIQKNPGTEGGVNFMWDTHDRWVEFAPQDFTGKTEIVIRASSATVGGKIEVRLDSLTGPIAAIVNIPTTHGRQNWRNFAAPLNGITGRHQVIIKFVGSRNVRVCTFEWFELRPYVAQPPRLGQPCVSYYPGCNVLGEKDEQMFTEAVEGAKNADLVVMVCGVDESVDREGHDRLHIRLTGVQHELIQACYQANPKTVLVLNTNNTVAVNWEHQHLPAIISAIYAGQAQGTAIADVLFGNYNPGGKTCCTWYKSVDQLPPRHNYDIMKGRTYMYFEGEPLYPFGYGLSYTTFRISGLHINSKELSQSNPIKIACKVKNTGSRTGAEVVQLYVTAPKSPVKRPIKELVGFQRVELKPGESRNIIFTLPYNTQALWYWHEDLRKFVLQPGTLKLMIGSSSAHILLTGEVQLRACAHSELGGPETLNILAAPVKMS